MNSKWSKVALIICTAYVVGQLITQAIAAVPYTLGGDTYADRFIADGGAGVQAFIAIQGSFSSRASSGTNAHETTVNGARTDFGAGASDYCSSDGTTVTFAGPVASAASGAALAVSGSGYLKLAGVATGSLPTCNAGAAGSLQYDTTATCYKQCNGAAWSGCLSDSSLTINGSNAGTFLVSGSVNFMVSEYTWTAYNPDALATEGVTDADLFLGPYFNFNGGGNSIKFQRIMCNWRTAGTGGGVVEIAVYDLGNLADICSCTLASCTSTAPLECNCNGTLANSTSQYAMHLGAGTTCTTNPGVIGCTVTIAQ